MDNGAGVYLTGVTHHSENVVAVVKVKICTTARERTVDRFQQPEGLNVIIDSSFEHFYHLHFFKNRQNIAGRILEPGDGRATIISANTFFVSLDRGIILLKGNSFAC
jgi:hypothetical protein